MIESNTLTLKTHKMKNLFEHKELAKKLRTENGYKIENVALNPITGEPEILAASLTDSAELFSVFGKEGYSFSARVI